MYKLLLIFIPVFISIFIGCNKSNNIDVNDISLIDYHYPNDSLLTPKVFIYQRIEDSNEVSPILRQINIRNDSVFLIERRLGQGTLRDSTVYLIENDNIQLFEIFNYAKDRESETTKLSKGEIVKDYNSLTKSESKVRFTSPFNASLITKIETYSELDSILQYKYNGDLIPSLRYQDHANLWVGHKYIPFLNKSIEANSKSIIAKNIGLVFYTTHDHESNQEYSYVLKNIIDYKEYCEK